jgi:hypothetical protein
MGDEEPGTSPMGAMDMAASQKYEAEATALHAQATAEESMAGVMDVWGAGGEMHKQAAEHERQADDDDTRSWRMYTAAQERDWAHEAQEEHRDIDRRQELAEVRERQAVDGLAKPEHTAHEMTNLLVERDAAHVELETLRKREETVQQQEDGMTTMAREDERLAREGEPPKP